MEILSRVSVTTRSKREVGYRRFNKQEGGATTLRSSRDGLTQVLDLYLRSESGEDVARACDNLCERVKTVEDVKLVAETARAAHRALIEEVQRRKELIETIEGRPNSILPIVAGVEPHGFIVSQGRGHYTLVGAMLDAETGTPVLTQDELAERGPCMGALSPDGSLIVQALWPEDHPDLALLIFGHDTFIIDGLDDELEGSGTPLPVPVPVGDDQAQ